MKPPHVIAGAAAFAASAVAAGAFGAHALAARVDAGDLQIWRTASSYQLTHAVALFALGVLLSNEPQSPRPLGVVAACFIAGMLIFSGTLYAMVLGGPRWLGAITPLGGASFIIGWTVLALWAFGRGRNRN